MYRTAEYHDVPSMLESNCLFISLIIRKGEEEEEEISALMRDFQSIEKAFIQH